MRKLMIIVLAFISIGAFSQDIKKVGRSAGNSRDRGRINEAITATNTNTTSASTSVDSLAAQRTNINTNTTGVATGVSTAVTNQGLNKLMADIVELYSFSVGTGAAGDTVLIAAGGTFDPVYLAGTDTAKVTELRCAMQTGEKVTGTDTIDVQISWHANLKDGSAVVLNTAALPVTSITSGTADTSFDNASIPPGVFIWGTIPATVTGRKPVQVVCTVSGYYAD